MISLVFSWFIRIFATMKSKWILLILVLFAMTACTSPSHEAMRQQLKYVSDCNRADTVFTERWLPTVDSLVAYFDHHGSANDRMMAHYVQGRVYHDMGEAPQALECYQSAAEQADTTRKDCDFLQLSRICAQTAHLFLQQNLPKNAISESAKAGHYAMIAQDSATYISCIEMESMAHYELQQYNEAMMRGEEAFRFNLVRKDFLKAYIALRLAIFSALKADSITIADKWLTLYEDSSGLVDRNSQALKGHEFYYALKGTSCLSKNNNKQAEFYFQALLASTNNLGMSARAYQGLYETYRNLHRLDSMAKYAVLYSQYNDSTTNALRSRELQQQASLYDYHRHVNEAQRLKEANTLRGWLLCLGLLTLLILLFLLLWVRAKARERKRRLQELHRINEELQAKYVLLTEDYEQKLEEMKRQQEQATDSEDSQSLSQKMEALSFAIRKANIKKEEIAMNTAHIQESAVFRRLQDEPTIARNDKSIWPEVEAVINEAYPGFTDRLQLLLPKMSGKEWQVSLLLKAQLTHQLIAEIICETQGGESNIRRRLSKKLFPSETPSSSKFDDFIGSL